MVRFDQGIRVNGYTTELQQKIIKRCQMKHAIYFGSIFLVMLFLLSSCTSSEILKALKIDQTPAKEQKSADQKTIADLKKQLTKTKKNETALKTQLEELKNKINEQETRFSEELTANETLFENKEASYNHQIWALKNELDGKEALITIQGRVIGLLDDADQTLQKSIEDQLQDK